MASSIVINKNNNLMNKLQNNFEILMLILTSYNVNILIGANS